MEKKLIYALKCPFTNDIHYIGKSTSGMLRPLSHLKESHSLKIQEWVSELKKIGHKPLVEILCYVSELENIDIIERKTIQIYLEKNCYLLNSNLVKPLSILPNLDAIDNKGIGNVSTFLKNKRKTVGLTQEELANKAGVALTVVRKIEQGKTNLNLEGLIVLLSMFGCKIDITKIENL